MPERSMASHQPAACFVVLYSSIYSKHNEMTFRKCYSIRAIKWCFSWFGDSSGATIASWELKSYSAALVGSVHYGSVGAYCSNLTCCCGRCCSLVGRLAIPEECLFSLNILHFQYGLYTYYALRSHLYFSKCTS